MLKTLLPVIYLVTLFCSCSQQKSSAPKNPKTDPTEQQTFFPVTEYIRGQLKEIEGLPVTPLKIITHDGQQDSIWMKKNDIRSFAEPFLHPEINTANFKSLFTVRSFLDQTINAFTFSYDPLDQLPDTLQLRRWDVYIDANKNTIQRIYMIKEVHNNNTSQTLQLTWKSGQWCKITTITEQAGKQPEVKEEQMKWDFNE
jgi:hypothetical protein